MAKVTLAAPISDIRGNVSGWTFSKNAAGNYAKNWSKPPRMRTEKQTAQRALIASNASLWSTLTQDQRDDWDTYAALPAQALTDSMGYTYYASGFNWFVALSTNLLRAGRSVIADAPTAAQPSAPTMTALLIRPSGDNPIANRNGTPSASTSEAGFGPELAVDEIISEASSWVALNTPTPADWIYTFDDEKTIRRIRYRDQPNQSANAAPAINAYYWDGAAYQSIGGLPAAQSYSTDWHQFLFTSDHATTKIKLSIGNISPPRTYVGISEIEMYEDTFDYSYLYYPLAEFSAAPTYDLVLHVATGKTIGQHVAPHLMAEITIRQIPTNPYIEIHDELEAVYGTIQTGRPWFANVFRQNMEGRRSAPTAIQTTS